MPSGWLVDGLLMALAASLALVTVRFLVALSRDEEPREALEITGRWSAGLVGAAGAAGAMGLVQFADIVAAGSQFVATHPFAVSNGVVTALGAFVAGGWLSLSSTQFVGVAVALVGAVMLMYEVGE